MAEENNKDSVVAVGIVEESDDASIIYSSAKAQQDDDAPSKSMDGTAHSSSFSTSTDDDNEESRRSCCCRRICCCFKNCTYPQISIILLHSCIMLLAVLCFVPTGAIGSKVRAHWGGIATLVWIIHCCVMVVSNLVYYIQHYVQSTRCRQDERKFHDDADANDSDVEEQVQADDESRLVYSCKEMGCLCSSSTYNEPQCCRKKIPWNVAIVVLLIVEGVLLLTPVLAPASTYKSIDGAISEAFPETEVYLAPNPKTIPFSFNDYLMPGGFSMSGGYTNRGKVKSFIYKEGCVPECQLDIHTVEGDNIPRPVIFEVHGGGWDSGAISHPKQPIGYWLDRGYAYASIQYRFPSQTPGGSTIWEQLDDVEDAFNYMINIGAENGIDTSRVVVTGDSAGGHLACVVAYRSKNPAIKGVLNFYGATEWKYYFDTGGKLLNLVMGKLLPGGATDDDFKAASCSTYATSSSPPLLTIHGTWDYIVPIRLSKYLHSVVDELGVPNLLIEVPLSDHVLELGFNSIGGQPSLYAAERFIAAQLLGS